MGRRKKEAASEQSEWAMMWLAEWQHWLTDWQNKHPVKEKNKDKDKEEKAEPLPDIPMSEEEEEFVLSVLKKLDEPIEVVQDWRKLTEKLTENEPELKEEIEELYADAPFEEEEPEPDEEDELYTKRMEAVSRRENAIFRHHAGDTLPEVTNYKQLPEFTEYEDMAIFRSIHSGDPKLIALANKVVGQSIVIERLDKDSHGWLNKVLISPLMGGPEMNNIVRSKGVQHAWGAVTDLYLVLIPKLKTWYPYMNGQRKHLSFFVIEHCKKSALEKVAESADTQARRQFQIRHDRYVAEAERFLRDHGITSPTLGDYRETLILYTNPGKLRKRNEWTIQKVYTMVGKRNNSTTYDNYMTTEDEAFEDAYNKSATSEVEDICDQIYAEKLTEEVYEHINIECLEELHDLHKRAVMAFIRASVDLLVSRETSQKKNASKDVPIAQIMRVFIDEFGGNPDINPRNFKMLVNTAVREYKKARMARALTEPRKTDTKYTAGIKLNSDFAPEEEDALKIDIQYMVENGLF